MSGSSSGAVGRILVVDDDLVTARFMAHVLGNRGGFEVRHALDPTMALAMAESESWDLVITDVEMPTMTGLELLEALRQVSPEVPVAVMTAHASVDYAVQAIRSHADEFLEKPVHPDQLIATATALITRGRAARQARQETVLAVGAHPDDVEIGAAGTLLAHLRMGDTVSILTLSHGARGGSQATRANESRRAAEILGAGLYLDDLQDTQISEGEQTIAAISRVVTQIQPTVVYTHSLHDVHQDHRNTHRAVMVAVRGVGRVYCFQSPSATVDFRPTRFVAIDSHVERKLAAIGAFASQVEIRAYLEPDLIRSTARYWSRFGEGSYAEAFEVIREAGLSPGHVPVATAQAPGGDPPGDGAAGQAIAAGPAAAVAGAAGHVPAGQAASAEVTRVIR
jgi:two-component system, NtrC family, response regulator HydG